MNGREEYGVRRAGGHIEAKVSRHVAIREAQERIEAGERGVWVVVRYVTDWEMA